MGVPKMDGLSRNISFKIDDLCLPLFQEPPKSSIYLHGIYPYKPSIFGIPP